MKIQTTLMLNNRELEIIKGLIGSKMDDLSNALTRHAKKAPGFVISAKDASIMQIEYRDLKNLFTAFAE